MSVPELSADNAPTSTLDDSIWISVSFDVDQYGNQLCWQVNEDKRNLMQTTGVFAGSLHLDRLTPVGIRVRCWGGEALASFQVLSAVIATIPSANSLPASPFQGVSTATYPLNGFPIVSGPPAFDPVQQRYFLQAELGPTTKTTDVDGGWQLKMALTAQFSANGETAPRTRVFYFDPESQVGNGTR